ncbi:unnamed protein product [Leptosia nina]|uniref:Serine/threonine-protein phosphatase 4 regulatory subunit 2 n=1 Tax=Leptosia nina TaxID=320188 RepID=A0AAV1J0Y9_9NEOP
MENAEEVFQFLEEFSKRKPKTIPQELNDYLVYVARTGDPVYQWSLVKCLFKEKLINVITDFHESTPSVDIPPCPNVDPFNYDIMKNSLIERLDTFTSAPFTVQRICELLTCPRKQYNRVDKFMRAIEKNILVVSTREPGLQRHHEPENGEPMEAMVNGSDNNSEYNVDVEMEDMSWKESGETRQTEPQPSSSDAHINVDDLEARLQAKQEEVENNTKQTTEYESVTPPELNVVEASDDLPESKLDKLIESNAPVNNDKDSKVDTTEPIPDQKIDVVMDDNTTTQRALVIPDIKVDDAEMTEQKLQEAQAAEKNELENKKSPEDTIAIEAEKISDEGSSVEGTKDEPEPKNISEASSSSEESSSSSENNESNSNSPKQDAEDDKNIPSFEKKDTEDSQEETREEAITPGIIQSENYSITDVNLEPPAEPVIIEKPVENVEEQKPETKTDETVDIPVNTETPET